MKGVFIMNKKNIFLAMTVCILIFCLMFVSCGDDPSYTEDQLRWGTWVQDPSLVITNQIRDDGVCVITLSGSALSQNWMGSSYYLYWGQRGKAYTYTFEAWTNSPLTRWVNVQYFGGGTAGPFGEVIIQVTSERKTFVINGDRIPWSFTREGDTQLGFRSADKLGTFFVKIISIEETQD